MSFSFPSVDDFLLRERLCFPAFVQPLSSVSTEEDWPVSFETSGPAASGAGEPVSLETGDSSPVEGHTTGVELSGEGTRESFSDSGEQDFACLAESSSGDDDSISSSQEELRARFFFISMASWSGIASLLARECFACS